MGPFVPERVGAEGAWEVKASRQKVREEAGWGETGRGQYGLGAKQVRSTRGREKVRAKFPQRETDGCKMGRAKLESADCRGEKGGTETGKAKLAWKSSGGEVGVRSGLGVKEGCTLEFVREAPKPSRWPAKVVCGGRDPANKLRRF